MQCPKPPDLFTQEEYDGIFAALRNEAKAAGVAETRDNMMEFFLTRVRANLHIVLCFSPVGDQFRIEQSDKPEETLGKVDLAHPFNRTIGIKDVTHVLEHWNVTPQQLPSLFALVGDAADNVKGIFYLLFWK